MTEDKFKFHPAWRHAVVLAIFVLALYVLLPQFGDFQNSWELLRRPDPGYTLLAFACTALTYAAAAAIYCLLAFKPLGYGRTLLVQLAATFVSRLLPAGIGSLGANYMYLRHQGHSVAQAASVVAINNPIGLIGHALIVAVALWLSKDHTIALPVLADNPLGWVLKVLIISGVILTVVAVLFGRSRLKKFMAEARLQLGSYRRRPGALVTALAVSIGLTLCNVLCLLFCLVALNIHLPFIAALLVLTTGVGVGSITPTPGGLGGFEAGLVAGLLAYQIDGATALAAVLLYRLLSYWLPLIGGAIAFVICQRRNLFQPG